MSILRKLIGYPVKLAGFAVIGYVGYMMYLTWQPGLHMALYHAFINDPVNMVLTYTPLQAFLGGLFALYIGNSIIGNPKDEDEDDEDTSTKIFRFLGLVWLGLGIAAFFINPLIWWAFAGWSVFMMICQSVEKSRERKRILATREVLKVVGSKEQKQNVYLVEAEEYELMGANASSSVARQEYYSKAATARIRAQSV